MNETQPENEAGGARPRIGCLHFSARGEIDDVKRARAHGSNSNEKLKIFMRQPDDDQMYVDVKASPAKLYQSKTYIWPTVNDAG